MLHKVAQEFNIDLSQSWIISVGENDVTGINAGCKTALINTECEFYGQTVAVKSLPDFMDQYLSDMNME